MEYAKNQKYFKKKNWIPVIVAAAIFVIGLIMLLVWTTKRFVGIGTMIVGVIVMIAALTVGMRDEDIDNAVASVTNRIEARAAEVFKFPRRYEVLHPQVTLGGFDFTRKEGSPVKRGKDLKFRCGYYTALLLSFTDDGLRLLSQKFSILEDDMREDILYFKWEEVESATHDEQQITVTTVEGKEETFPICNLHLNMKDGTVYTYCVRNNADVDDTEDIIYRQNLKVKREELKARGEIQ